MACTGLVARLRSAAMPFLPKRGAAERPRGRFTKVCRGGSSPTTGKRIDAEVGHLVECVRGLAGEGMARRMLSPHARVTAAAGCPTCGLKGKRYARPLPAWHTWTCSYLRDCDALGVTLVASQVAVGQPATRLGTELDDVGVTREGTILVIERKSGYEDAPGRPTSQRVNELTVHTGVAKGAAYSSVSMPNTEHTLHHLQAEASLALWRDLCGRALPPAPPHASAGPRGRAAPQPPVPQGGRGGGGGGRAGGRAPPQAAGGGDG